MQPAFNFSTPRNRFLVLLCFLGFIAGSATLALSTPDNQVLQKDIPENPSFQSGLLASPAALYQVSSNKTSTRVTVTQGGLLVRSQGHKYDILTPDGVVTVTSGEAIVLAQEDTVKVEVIDGTAEVQSPYLVSASGEATSPLTLAAGESAQGSLLGPEEEVVLEGLGMHEVSGALADLEMAETPLPIGELAMAEFGPAITSLGFSEAAVAGVAAPVLGGATAAAGLAGLADSLNTLNQTDELFPVSP